MTKACHILNAEYVNGILNIRPGVEHVHAILKSYSKSAKWVASILVQNGMLLRFGRFWEKYIMHTSSKYTHGIWDMCTMYG
jgi:hypothetical protein